MSEPTVKCSSDKEWREFYERQCTNLRHDLQSEQAQNKKLREALKIATFWMFYSKDGDPDNYDEAHFNKYEIEVVKVKEVLAALAKGER